jgi:hypothetical protein
VDAVVDSQKPAHRKVGRKRKHDYWKRFIYKESLPDTFARSADGRTERERSKTGIMQRMANDDFAEVQRQLEAITLELRTVNDSDRRRTLLREMSRLVGEAERISGQPPKMSHNPEQI